MIKDQILLVEDEPDLLQTLAFNFENEGYKVAKALDGKEAIKLSLIHISEPTRP